MNITLLRPAVGDLVAAVSHFNAEREGLGAEFKAELEESLERIARFPEAWSPLELGVRHCRMHRFKHGVYYLFEGGEVLVLAIIDLRRDPETWRSRLRELRRLGIKTEPHHD